MNPQHVPPDITFLERQVLGFGKASYVARCNNGVIPLHHFQHDFENHYTRKTADRKTESRTSPQVLVAPTASPLWNELFMVMNMTIRERFFLNDREAGDHSDGEEEHHDYGDQDDDDHDDDEEGQEEGVEKKSKEKSKKKKQKTCRK